MYAAVRTASRYIKYLRCIVRRKRPAGGVGPPRSPPPAGPAGPPVGRGSGRGRSCWGSPSRRRTGSGSSARSRFRSLLDPARDALDLGAGGEVQEGGARAGGGAGARDPGEIAVGDEAEHHRIKGIDLRAEGAGEGHALRRGAASLDQQLRSLVGGGLTPRILPRPGGGSVIVATIPSSRPPIPSARADLERRSLTSPLSSPTPIGFLRGRMGQESKALIALPACVLSRSDFATALAGGRASLKGGPRRAAPTKSGARLSH